MEPPTFLNPESAEYRSSAWTNPGWEWAGSEGWPQFSIGLGDFVTLGRRTVAGALQRLAELLDP